VRDEAEGAGGATIRRATPEDADFIASLLDHEDVEPFLSARRPSTREEVLERIERSRREPTVFGVFVIESDGRLAGTMEFEEGNRRSRIAHLGGLAVHPDFRARGLAEEAAHELKRHLLLDLGYHRLQLEVYAFNERAKRHSERVGFRHEGDRRLAYRRHGTWVGSSLYAVVREDLGLPPGVDLLYELVARHNRREWEWLGDLYTEDAVLEFVGAPVGPFAGREAIVAAYTERPPDDEVRILSAEDGDPVVAHYAWLAEPETDAGTMTLTVRDGLVSRLVVSV